MDSRLYQPRSFQITRDSSQPHDKLLESNNNSSGQRKIPPRNNQSVFTAATMKGLLIAGGVLLVICSIVVIPTALAVIFTRNPSVTNATSTSTVASIVRTAYWSFDNITNDMYGTYNGVLVNGATYSDTTYFGFGYNLYLNDSLNQSMIVSSPYLNLSYTSFTVEAWIYGYSFTGDSSIFSQCRCSTCEDQCLYLIIRNQKMYMGFTLDDVIGVTTLSTNTWYHVAFVYDYSTLTQSLYLQGVLDNSASPAGPFQGQNLSTVIGSSQLPSGGFRGMIDNLRVTTRAKSATAILRDATMVVHFSFDGSTLSEDVGPNKMNGTISNVAAATGKVGQGLAFSGAVSSYLQVSGFYQLGRSNQPFSFSLWIYPYSVTGGTIIQKSAYANTSGWCYNFLGINYLGLVSMIAYHSSGPQVIVGPILSVRKWTHVGYTYSTTNGIQMYINGVFYATTGAAPFSSSGGIDYLNIGSYIGNNCGMGPYAVYQVPYQGVLDEFYVYRRELNASEILALANP